MKFNFTLMPEKRRSDFGTIEEYDKYNEERESHNIKTIITWVATGLITLLLAAIIFSSFKVIEAGSIGIVTRFGKVDRVADSGLMFKLPFIENVVKMDTRVQKEEMNASAATKDMQDVMAKVAINYSINKETALEIYNKLGVNYKDNIIIPAASESFKAGISEYTAEGLILNRAEAKENILEDLKERLAGNGIAISDLNIVDLNFSETFNQAIEAKAVAQQQVETAKQELERAKIDAEKKKAEAEGEAAAQRAQQETLTDLMIKKMWIEKWNGQLPTTMTDDAGILMGQ